MRDFFAQNERVQLRRPIDSSLKYVSRGARTKNAPRQIARDVGETVLGFNIRNLAAHLFAVPWGGALDVG
jgi:hypothetical protein